MNEWCDFFDGYAPQYMDEPFVTGTSGEVGLIARELAAEHLATGSFDLETMVESEMFTWAGPEGERTLVGRQRMYVPTELVILFRQAGFVVEHVGGGTAGAFARRPLDLDEMEIMVIARKPGNAEA